jgi:hypothetical protein
MRNILALVGAATVAFLALGWYLGWYQVSSVPSPRGQQSVHVDINPTKITEDVKKGVEKGGEIVDSLRDRPSTETKPAPAAGPASSFFTPTKSDPTGSSNGWRPIAGSRAGDDEGRVPRN